MASDEPQEDGSSAVAGPSFASRLEPPSPSPSSNTLHGVETIGEVEDGFDASHSHQAIPRMPMHRSISVPLSDRMGLLRHPKPRSEATANQTSGTARGDAGKMRESLEAYQGSGGSSTLDTAAEKGRDIENSTSRLLRQDPTTAASGLAHLVLDTLQLPIAHLLNVIPPHLLDASHETLSATSVAVPVTTIEALMEAFRSINWICGAVAEEGGSQGRGKSVGEAVTPSSSLDTDTTSTESGILSLSSRSAGAHSDTASSAITTPPLSLPSTQPSSDGPFDLLELGQRAADVVSGQASEKGIELILGWGGISSTAESNEDGLMSSMQALAFGNEGAVKCVVTHVLAKTIELAPAASALYLGIQLGSESVSFSLESHDQDGTALRRFQQVAMDPLALRLADASIHTSSDQAGKSSVILTIANVVAVSGAADAQTDQDGSKVDQPYHKQRFLPRLTVAEEPTLPQLSHFRASSLKGMRIALHARSSSCFAHGLESLLSRWGCKVHRLSLDGTVSSPSSKDDVKPSDNGYEHETSGKTAIALADGRPTFVRYESGLVKMAASSASPAENPSQAILDPVTGVPVTLPVTSSAAPPASQSMRREASHESSSSSTSTVRPDDVADESKIEAFSFLMIDDNVETLQQELLRMRSALPMLRSALGQTTPGPMSGSRSPFDKPLLDDADRSALAHESAGDAGESPRTYAIIYFSSLKNFRSVRDVVQPIMESALHGPSHGRWDAKALMPEIIVIPKPAGARRIMTALHTAVQRPLVDPFFAPIATSPMSPHLFEAKLLSTRGILSGSSDNQQNSPTKPTQAPSTPPTGVQKSTHASQKSSRSPGKKRSAMRINNFPRPDPASLMATPSLPTPLRQEISMRTESTPGAKSPDSTSSSSMTRPKAQLPVTSSSPRALPTPSASSVRSSHGSSSPMPVEALEYFSETAAKFGGAGGAGGMMIASTDGRPAGIFFQPKRSSRSNDGSLYGSSKGQGGSANGSARGHATSRPSSESAHSIKANQAKTPPTSGRTHRRGSSQSSSESSVILDDSRSNARALANAPRAEGSQTETNRSAAPAVARVHSAHGSQTSADDAGKADQIAGTVNGMLYSPTVGLGQIMSSGIAPVATPLAEIRAASSEQSSVLREADSAPSTNGTTGQDPGPREARNTQESETREPGPSARADTVPRSVENQSAGRMISDDGEESIQGSVPGRAEVSASAAPVATSHQASVPQNLQATATRPSAQPQSGLLIGAGFASTARRGGAVRRAAVREKVLPPIKVLIVEDNPINQRILKQFMTRKKIKFETAVNGKEAVEKWAKGGFHLILMDIQLPVMDGIEATTEIRKQEGRANVGILPANSPLNPPTANGGKLEAPAVPSATPTPSSASTDVNGAAMPTPFQASVIIVALTASSLNSDRVAALAAGCNDFLQKPVNHVFLEKKIIEWGSMQYILLSGAGVFDAERKAARLAARSSASAAVSGGQGALAAAAANSDLRRAFGSAPNAQARQLANRLHLPASAAMKKRANQALAAQTAAAADSAGTSATDSDGAEARPSNLASSSVARGGIAADLGSETQPSREAQQLAMAARRDPDAPPVAEEERTRASNVAAELGQQASPS